MGSIDQASEGYTKLDHGGAEHEGSDELSAEIYELEERSDQGGGDEDGIKIGTGDEVDWMRERESGRKI